MAGNIDRLRAGLQKMGKPQLLANVAAAALALKPVGGAVGQVAAAKHSVLGTEVALQKALAALKTVAARQSEQSSEQVKNIAQRQQQVVATVDERVRNALLLIVAISSAIVVVVVAAAQGLTTVRAITRRLDAAVRMAEAVSAGRLDDVPVLPGQDETTRLLAATGTLVQTLRAMLAQIHQASHSIQLDPQELVQGKQGAVVVQVHEVSTLIQTLSSASQDQSASLGQVSNGVTQIDEMTRRNAALAEQGTAASKNLHQQAEGLIDAVAVLKLAVA